MGWETQFCALRLFSSWYNIIMVVFLLTHAYFKNDSQKCTYYVLSKSYTEHMHTNVMSVHMYVHYHNNIIIVRTEIVQYSVCGT